MSNRPTITPTTPGPGLAILCICSAGASALVAGTAVLYQARLQRSFSIFDLDTNWNILLAFGLFVSVAQSAVTFKQVDYGLGYPISKESRHDLIKFQKFEYANNLLYVFALLLLKAVHFLLQHATIMPKPKAYIPIAVTFGMFSFLLAAAFECSAPDFWALRSTKCFDQTAFWIAFGLFDIITEIYSLGTLLRATMFLQMQNAAKAKLIIVLCTQILPVICAIARLPFVHGAYTSPDYTIEAYKLAIPTQLQLHLAVVALSMGKIFRFLNTMNAGYLTSAIDAPSRSTTAYANKYLNSKTSQQDSHVKKNPSISESSKDLVPRTYGSSKAIVEHLPMEPSSAWKRSEEEAGSDNEIRVTREVHITYEPQTSESWKGV